MKVVISDWEIRELIKKELKKRFNKDVQHHEISIKENELSEELQIFAEYEWKDY